MKAWLLTTMVGAAGCSEPGWESVVEVGRVAYLGGQPEIAVPGTAAVNVPIHVSVSTDGGGCISLESTDVVANGDGFTITPYDRRMVPGLDEACTLELVLLDHGVDVTFARAGTATLVVHVRGGGQPGEMVDLPFSVAVR